MWRTVASLGLMFFAVGGSAFAVLIIFLVVPALWESLFGPSGAAFGALAALGLMTWCFARLMRFADRLLGEPDRRRQPALAPVKPDVPADWQTYTAEIVRSKRWAFYRRTRQFDRLAELEAQARAERDSSA